MRRHEGSTPLHPPAVPVTRQGTTKQPLVWRSQKGHWRPPSPNGSTYTPTYLSKFPSNFIRHCTQPCKTREQATDCEDRLSNSARSLNLKHAFPRGNVTDSAHSSAVHLSAQVTVGPGHAHAPLPSPAPVSWHSAQPGTSLPQPSTGSCERQDGQKRSSRAACVSLSSRAAVSPLAL